MSRQQTADSSWNLFASLRLCVRFLLCCLLSAVCSLTLAQPPRPLVVLFPAGQGSGAGISGEKDEGATAAGRIMAATRALRDRLAESNALLALMYSPDSPTFVLAAQQANLDLKTLKSRGELKPEEQYALGKAAGAVYILTVSSPKVLTKADETEREGEYEFLISGREVGAKGETGKLWTDKATFFTSYKPKENDKSPLTNKPFTVKDAQTSLDSAANTLAVRLLSGPLGDYGRPAAAPNQLPSAKPKPTAPEEPPVAETDQSSAALQQARAQIGDGDNDGAISTLRKAVNRSPLDMSLRLALAKAYLAADRNAEAMQETKRALTLSAADNREERAEFSRILADSLKKGGDPTGAKEMYRQIIAAQPRAAWAHIGLGDLLISTGEADAAEKEYRAALEIEPGSQDAAAGVARVHAAKGEYEAALNELTAGGKSGTPNARQNAVISIFNDAAPELARRMQTNREAWEGKRLSRETFYNATQSQSRRAATLLSLLRAAPPADSAPEATRKAHARRILAASLLAQAASSLLSYLDSGDAEAGAQSAVYLDDFQKEMTELRGK